MSMTLIEGNFKVIYSSPTTSNLPAIYQRINSLSKRSKSALADYKSITAIEGQHKSQGAFFTHQNPPAIYQQFTSRRVRFLRTTKTPQGILAPPIPNRSRRVFQHHHHQRPTSKPPAIYQGFIRDLSGIYQGFTSNLPGIYQSSGA